MEKLKVEDFELYKKKCEKKLREEGIYKQQSLLKVMLRNFYFFIGGSIFEFIFVFIADWLFQYEGIGELLGSIIGTMAFSFTLIKILGLLFIFVEPILVYFKNKKHLTMSKVELENELENKINFQQKLYDEFFKKYNEDTNFINKEKIDEIFNKIKNGEILKEADIKKIK